MSQQNMPMGYNRPASTTPQMFNQQGGQPMVMMNGPAHQFMPGQAQPHVQMYSPAPGQAYPVQPGPGTPNFSPRAPPMMMQQGSQQGHAAPMMYMSHSQQGQPMYYSQGPSQPSELRPILLLLDILANYTAAVQVRGGYPMQPQHSYGASPNMPQQYPMHNRGGPQQYTGYSQPPMHPGQGMPHQNAPHGEVK